MALVRTLLNFLVAGALLGVLAASLLWPRFLTWDNTPGLGKALCDCADNTRQTASRLIYGQMVGSAIGAGLGLAGGVAFVVLRRKKDKAQVALSPPPPAAKG